MDPIEEENLNIVEECDSDTDSYSDSDQSSPIRKKKRGKRMTCECDSDSELDSDARTMPDSEPNADDRFRDLICRMIVIDGLPLHSVEFKGFQKLCVHIQPRFVMPSWQTVVMECNRLYIKEKEKLKKMLVKQRQGVSLSINAWKTVHDLEYMVITAHFIDDDWKLHRKIVNFCLTPMDALDIVVADIERSLLEWGIERVFTLTVDDGICDDGALTYLAKKISTGNEVVLNGEFMHVRGCTHIVNLLVSDALKGFEDSINKIRNAIRYVMSLTSRFEAFTKCLKEEKISCNEEDDICFDTPNRWDSTYIMLDNVEKFQKAFERLEAEDSEFCMNFIENESKPPNAEDWNNARTLVKLLKIFHDASLKISRWSCVTSHRFFPELCLIQEQILKYLRSDNPLFNDIGRNMKAKYEKYWGNIEKMNYLLFVPIVLDPRYKLEFLMFTLSFLYGEEKSKDIGKKVEDTTRRLYDEYQTLNMEGEIALTPIDQMLVEGDEDLASRFTKHLIQQDIKESKTELDKYLSEACEVDDEKFDLLDWWKLTSSKYKILSKMAKDVFAIPLSTAPPGFAFSTGVQVLDTYRSLLPYLLVEVLVCLQNWLRSPQDIDEYKPMDEPLDIYKHKPIDDLMLLEDEFSRLLDESSESASMKVE